MATVSNDDIEISFDSKRCIHARRCVLTLPEVFKPGTKGGWIFPEQASTAALTAMIDQCPSGALSYEYKQNAPESYPRLNTARLWQNGPIELTGHLLIDGKSIKHATLCRCGQSNNKPYCDNSHIKAQFTASAEVNAKEAPGPIEVHTEPVDIKPKPNGPLLLEGPLEIMSASGRHIANGSKHFICRCGASKNKPFCDGAHKAIEFQTE